MAKRITINQNYEQARRRALKAELDRLQAYLDSTHHPADETTVLNRMSELVAQLYL